MKLAFYKGKGNFFNGLIRWWTRSKYSHVELVLTEMGLVQLCASSSNWDGGVRTKYLKLNPDKWDIIDISHLPFSDEKAVFWYNEHNGRKYDYIGLFTFVFDFMPTNKNKYFCSEAVMSALGFEKPDTFSPADIYRIFSKFKK